MALLTMELIFAVSLTLVENRHNRFLRDTSFHFEGIVQSLELSRWSTVVNISHNTDSRTAKSGLTEGSFSGALVSQVDQGAWVKDILWVTVTWQPPELNINSGRCRIPMLYPPTSLSLSATYMSFRPHQKALSRREATVYNKVCCRNGDLNMIRNTLIDSSCIGSQRWHDSRWSCQQTHRIPHCQSWCKKFFHFETGRLLIKPTIRLQKPWRAYGCNPDRLREDGLFYVSHIQVDDGTLHLDDEDVYDFNVDFPAHEEKRRQTNMTVSLMDIAKPARQKGKPSSLSLSKLVISLELNIVPRKSVITVRAHGIADYDFEDFIELDHSDAFSVFSEDWEELCSNVDVGHERNDSFGEWTEDLPSG